MPRDEHLTRMELIDPIMHDLGWTGAMIREEKTPGGSDILDGLPPKWRHERAAALTYKNKAKAFSRANKRRTGQHGQAV